MKKYSRRQFTKLAAAGGICAAVGALTGCFGAATDYSENIYDNGTETNADDTGFEDSGADNIFSDNSMADSDAPMDEVSSDSSSENNSLSGSNILVAYFSCTGTTEQIAKWVADISGGVENMEQYDFIFLGYPIWHGQAPRIISTFLESYDFSNVTIIPFCTSHSSGIGSSAQNLHSLISDTVTWLDGRRFSGSATETDVSPTFRTWELSYRAGTRSADEATRKSF